MRCAGCVLTVLSGLGPSIGALHVVDGRIVRCWFVNLEAISGACCQVARVVQTCQHIHLDPHMGGVSSHKHIFGDGNVLAVGWNGVVPCQLNVVVTIRVEGYSQHVVVSVGSFVATGIHCHSDWHIGAGHDIGHAVEREAAYIVEGIVWDLLTDVFNTHTDFLGGHTLLVVSNGHGTVVGVVTWSHSGVSKNQTDLTVFRARWSDLVDTVVVQVVDFPIVGVGGSVFNEREHKIVTYDVRGEVVRVHTLIR